MVWFVNNRLFITTDDNVEYSVPLEAFPVLHEATDVQRAKYRIGPHGESLHWPDLDEDIHVSSFMEDYKVNYNNEVNDLLSRFPCLDLKAFAKYVGMHWTKLARFRAGVWTASPETMQRLRSGLHTLGKEMSAA